MLGMNIGCWMLDCEILRWRIERARVTVERIWRAGVCIKKQFFFWLENAIEKSYKFGSGSTNIDYMPDQEWTCVFESVFEYLHSLCLVNTFCELCHVARDQVQIREETSKPVPIKHRLTFIKHSSMAFHVGGIPRSVKAKVLHQAVHLQAYPFPILIPYLPYPFPS